MKILALSLLRTGDLFMHEALLEKIKELHPSAEIHLLVNDLNTKAVQLLNIPDKVHILNRSYQQKYLIEENRSWLRAQQNLRQLVQSLNHEKFDAVYNFTHTFFSARLMDAIEAKKKSGIHFQNGQLVPMENHWTEYLNNYFSQTHRTEFHYIGLLAKSVGLAIPDLRKQQLTENQNKICLQVLTSDPKKNWPLQKFYNLATQLARSFPQNTVTILGAPDEKEQILKIFGEAEDLQLLFPLWNELPEILRKTRLLISGDTSVQHLAVQFSVPIVSLFLGSANPRKTAPYQEGAIVLQSQVGCTPCFHSANCPMPSHLCANDLKTSDVALVCEAILRQQDLPQVSARVYQARQNQNQIFFLQQIDQEAIMENLNHQFEQIIWQIYLDGGYRDLAGPYGTSAHHILEEYFNAKQSDFFQMWLRKRLDSNSSDKMFLEELEQRILRAAANQHYDESAFQVVIKDCLDLLQSYQLQRNERADYFLSLQQCFSEKAALFPMLRKIKSGIFEAGNLLNIESKFIQTLMNEMKERGHRYVSGTRKLSEACTSQA